MGEWLKPVTITDLDWLIRKDIYTSIYINVWTRRFESSTVNKENNMEQHERIKWLQENYGNYPTKWYEEDPKRTNAIFIKQYGVYIDNAFTDLKEQQKKMLDLRQTLCEEIGRAHV